MSPDLHLEQYQDCVLVQITENVVMMAGTKRSLCLGQGAVRPAVGGVGVGGNPQLLRVHKAPSISARLFLEFSRPRVCTVGGKKMERQRGVT